MENKTWNTLKNVNCCNWPVLPTVYSDALSYGEQLDKFCYQLNKIIENINILPDFIQDLIRKYISSGEIDTLIKDILAKYILNVKYPPNDITPAVGDGSADDTKAIQGCIDYAFKNGGGAVYIPSGMYSVNSLEIKSNVSLFSFNKYSASLVLRSGAKHSLIYSNSGNNMAITKLTLNSNMGVQVVNTNVISINGDNISIDDCVLDNGFDLLSIESAKGNTILNNIIFNSCVNSAININGTAYVTANNLIISNVSRLSTSSPINISSNNGRYDLISYAECDTALNVSGNNNYISATIFNAKQYFIGGDKNHIYISNYTDNINVIDYGAVSDGVTDSYNAFQSAIKAANTANKAVYVPKGNYYISKTIKISGYGTFINGNNSVINTDVNGALFSIVGENQSKPCQYTYIKDFIINCNGNKTIGVEFTHVFLTTLENVNLNSPYIGFKINSGFGTYILKSNLYLNKYAGIIYNTDSNSFVASGLYLWNILMDNSEPPVLGGIVWNSGEGVHANGCEIIRQNINLYINPNTEKNGCRFGFFTDCTFDLGQTNNLKINCESGDIYSINFTNCWFATAKEKNIDIISNSYIWGLMFNSCEVYYSAKGGFYLTNSTGKNENLSNVIIANSNISSNSTNQTNTYDAITLNNVKNININNNIFDGGTLVLPSHQRYGVNIDEKSDNIIITNNNFSNVSTTGISNKCKGHIIVQNNINAYTFKNNYFSADILNTINGEKVQIFENGATVIKMKKDINGNASFSLMFNDRLFINAYLGIQLYITANKNLSGALEFITFSGDIIDGTAVNVTSDLNVINVNILANTTYFVQLPASKYAANPNAIKYYNIVRNASSSSDTINDDIYLLGINLTTYES